MLTTSAAGSAEQSPGDQAIQAPGREQSTTSQVAKPGFSRPSGFARTAEEPCSAVLPGAPANGTTPTAKSRPVNPAGSSFTEVGKTAAAESTYGTNIQGFGDASSDSTLEGAVAAPGLSLFGAMPLGNLQSSGMAGKLYVSPAALRRILRDSPDLETRIRVRRQLEGLRKKPAHSTESSRSERTMMHVERQPKRSTLSPSGRSQGSSGLSHP